LDDDIANRKLLRYQSQVLRKYLADFQNVEWYSVENRIYAEGDTAKMILDLPRNDIFRPTVDSACAAMPDYINSNDNKKRLFENPDQKYQRLITRLDWT
jgi:hypothetical protein